MEAYKLKMKKDGRITGSTRHVRRSSSREIGSHHGKNKHHLLAKSYMSNSGLYNYNEINKTM